MPLSQVFDFFTQYVDEEGKLVYNMCKAFDDYKKEGKREGKQEMQSRGLKA